MVFLLLKGVSSGSIYYSMKLLTNFFKLTSLNMRSVSVAPYTVEKTVLKRLYSVMYEREVCMRTKFAACVVIATVLALGGVARAQMRSSRVVSSSDTLVYGEGPVVYKRDGLPRQNGPIFIVTIVGCQYASIAKIDETRTLLKCGEREVGFIIGGSLTHHFPVGYTSYVIFFNGVFTGFERRSST